MIFNGMGSGVNFQPAYGTWDTNETGDSLIHNDLESFRTAYKIVELSETRFVREYERIVQQTSDPERWPVGDTLTYREIFVPKQD